MFDNYLKTGLMYALCVVIFYVASMVREFYLCRIGRSKSDNLFAGIVVLGASIAGGFISMNDPILWVFIGAAVVSGGTLFLMWRKYTRGIS